MSKRNSRTRSQIGYKSILKEKEIEQSKQKIITPPNFEFVCKTYTTYLNCLICEKLMKHPTRLYNCGHTFCNDCITTTKCPVCASKIIVKQKNLIAIGMINQLKVRCLNNGCPFNGTYEEFINDHGKNCKLKEGMDNWMSKMQALMADFNTCKMKQTLSNEKKQAEQTQNNQNIHQNEDKDEQNNKISKSVNFLNQKVQKEQQQSFNRRRKNLMQFINEQQLLSKPLIKEL